MAASAPRAAYGPPSAVPARAAARRAVERGAYRLAWDAPQLASCANHPLSGLTLVGLARFIARHRGDVEPLRFARRLAFLTALAAFNTLLAVVEVLLYGVAVSRTPLNPRPVFILGQPRSGTTHVHNLLSRDTATFAHATTFDVGFPSCFLWTRAWLPALLGDAVLSPTRPMDNMALAWDLPQEDELASSQLSGGVSPYAAICALRGFESLLPLWTLRARDGARDADVAAWRAAFLHFLRKLQYRAGPHKRLLLKSPVHTARIETLLDIFPHACFICVHRDPYAVFASGLNMADKYYGYSALQMARSEDVLAYVLAQFECMHEAYVRDATRLLGRGHGGGAKAATACGSIDGEPRLVEVGFEQLDSDPLAAVARIYDGLRLDGGALPAAVAAAVRAYLQSLGDFKKNSFAPLPTEARELVRERWRAAFEDFGYDAGDG